MQSKGIIRFFAILLIIICLYQLTFTWVTNNAEKKAIAYANKFAEGSADSAKTDVFNKSKQDYLDSISGKTIYNLGFKKWTYQQCKEQQLALGLDLQGGMSVVLQVSLEDLIRNMAGGSTDPAFVAALEQAKKNQANSNKDLVALFGEAYQKANPTGQLATLFATRENKDKIQIGATNAQVLDVIQKEAKEAVKRTYSIITSRIDKFGTSSSNISLDESTGRIDIELPGVENPRRVRKILQATAQLEFWETYDNKEVINYLGAANQELKKIVTVSTASNDTNKVEDKPLLESKPDTNTTQASKEETEAEKTEDKNDTSKSLLSELSDTNKTKDDTSFAAYAKENPLFAKLELPQYESESGQRKIAYGGPVCGYTLAKDTATVMSYLNNPRIKGLYPKNLKFLWGAKPIQEGSNAYALFAIRTRLNDNKAPLDGSVIVEAKQDYDNNGRPDISMQMNSEGAKLWKKLTGANIGKAVAVVLDNQVYSAPNVQSEISGGNSQISGSFSIEEAQDLSAILKAGKLPAPARIVQEELIGPTLGSESIKSGLISLLVGLLLIMALMVLVYSTSGWVACGILLLNLLFVIGFLASIGTALTLAGMAGILLTIAIAVDANILVFERVKEELAKGSNLKTAVKDGYQHALSSIIDANITNLITGFVMLYFGLGPVKGFAVVLVAGIISSLFTAVLVSRLVFDWMQNKGKDISFSTAFGKNLFSGINFDFVGKRKIGYIVSGTVITVGILSMFAKGFDYGVDFRGGRTYTVRFDKPVNASEVRNALTSGFDNQAPIVKIFGETNQVKITTSYKINEGGLEVDSLVERKLYDGLKSFLGNTDFNTFSNVNKMSSQKVGPTIADDIKSTSWIAAIVSIILIFIYIVFRFRKWQYGLGAILATIHDVMFVLAIFSLCSSFMPFSLEVDQTFIAAILTIIGYSLNDTVVVFDRIREYLGVKKNQDMKQVINSAINDTLSRTLMTSLVTFLVIIVLFLFGGEVIRGFSFAMLLGVVVGTYSSIFIATPVVIDLTKEETIKVK